MTEGVECLLRHEQLGDEGVDGAHDGNLGVGASFELVHAHLPGLDSEVESLFRVQLAPVELPVAANAGGGGGEDVFVAHVSVGGALRMRVVPFRVASGDEGLGEVAEWMIEFSRRGGSIKPLTPITTLEEVRSAC